MDQGMNSLLAGLAGGLEKYLGASIANNMEQKKQEHKSALDLAKDQKMELFKGEVDTAKMQATKLYELTLAGKIDPETASTISPEGAKFVEAFQTKNQRVPTVDEFDKLFSNSTKQGEQKLRREELNEARTNRYIIQHKDKLAAAKVPELVNTFNELSKSFSEQKDVPGIGVLDSHIPNILLGDDGKSNRTNLQQIANVVLQQRSGAAVSDQEYKRFLTEISGGKMPDEATIRKHIGKMGKDMQKFIQLQESGLPQDALQEYYNRPGAIKNTDVNIYEGVKETKATPPTSGGWSIKRKS